MTLSEQNYHKPPKRLHFVMHVAFFVVGEGSE